MNDPTIISRAASLLVSGLYVALALWGVFPRRSIGSIGPAIAIALPLIWFPNFSAAIRGFIGRASVHSEEPEAMIVFMGWLILLIVPLVVAWLSADAQPAHVLPH